MTDKEQIDCWGPQGQGGCPDGAVFEGEYLEGHEDAGWGFTVDPRPFDAPAFYACPKCKDHQSS